MTPLLDLSSYAHAQKDALIAALFKQISQPDARIVDRDAWLASNSCNSFPPEAIQGRSFDASTAFTRSRRLSSH